MPVDLDIRENELYKMAVIESERSVLIRLLKPRFGPLPAPLLAKISKADIATVDEWIDRTATATSLEDIFGTASND